MSAFASIHSPVDTRRSLVLSAPQVALVIALEPFLQKAGLWVVCKQCAQDTGTYSHINARNSPHDAVWNIDCLCTRRRFSRANLTHTMPTDGDLFLSAEEILKGTGLANRCPVKKTRCLTTPLTITAMPDGVEMRCQCWQIALGHGVYRIRKTTPQVVA